MISVHFQGKPFNIMVIQVYALTSNAEEAEVEQFYEDLQDLLELTPKKDVLFIIGDWNAKVGSQETPGVTGKFGFGVQNEAGQRLIEFFQKNALVTFSASLCAVEFCPHHVFSQDFQDQAIPGQEAKAESSHSSMDLNENWQ